MSAALRWSLAAAQFACPLLFFTNLTRNPYISQIVLLNFCLLAALAAWAWGQARAEGGWRLPPTPLWAPWALFAGVWAASWLRAYLLHPPFFRPAMAAEGARNGLFLAVNALGAFLLGAASGSREDEGEDVELGHWAAFVLLWGGLWFLYPSLRSRVPGRPEDLWPLVWDPYGAAVWAGGLAAAARLTRRGRWADFVHLAFAAGFLASAYGVLQYFNVELVWPHVLNPYGGRAVSTFGNPNFLSTYNVILMPLAFASFLSARTGPRRAAYAVLFLILHAALLATLTRSSWVGAAAACAALLAFPGPRARLRESPRAAGLLVAAAVVLALAWPSSAIRSGYTPTVLGRLAEVRTLGGPAPYSPWHQRVLIWTCAWRMGAESPWLGKGAGLLELFYPFYQGAVLHGTGFYNTMRTHANNAHNEVLEIFSQTGLAGLGAWLWMWVVFFWAAWKNIRTRRGQSPLWAGAVAGVAGVLADNLLNVSLHFAVPGMLFWWTAGAASARTAEGGPLWRGARASRAAAAALLTAALLAAGWVWGRVWVREARYFSGFKLIRQGQAAAAIRELERSRSAGPREVNALYELGNVYARLSRPGEAADAYRAALSANAGYDEIYFNLATILSAHFGRPEEALPYYETAWAMNPLSPEIVNALAAHYIRDPKRWAGRAAPLLLTAARVFPDNPGYWNNLGYFRAAQERWKESEEAYAKALALAPDMEQARANLEAVAQRSGRPRHPLLGALGRLRELEAAVARRDWSPAVMALAKDLGERHPELGKARFIYGGLLLARGRAQEAARVLEELSAEEPRRAAVKSNLAAAYAALGRRAEAAALLREALGLEPGNPQLQAQLSALEASP